MFAEHVALWMLLKDLPDTFYLRKILPLVIQSWSDKAISSTESSNWTPSTEKCIAIPSTEG